MQNFEVVIVDDRKLIETIANFKIPVSLDFVHENYKQMSFSLEELKARRTGILSSMFPSSWQKPDVTLHELSHEERQDQLKVQIMSAPVVGLVLYDPSRWAPASEGDFLGIISLGCVMENMWLMASAMGIDFHIISSLSNAPVEGQIKKLLGIPIHLRLAFSFRMGYAERPVETLRVRREVQDFTHANHYGKKYS